MASMTIYRPECTRCKSRATFQVTGASGKTELFCGAHAKTALFDLTKEEAEAAAHDRSVAAERVEAVRDAVKAVRG